MKMLPSSAYSVRFADPPGDGGEQVVLRGDRLRAGVHEHEAAGAVGVLHHAGAGAGLPEQRGLLVARDAGDRNRRRRTASFRHTLRSTSAPPAAPSAARRRGRSSSSSQSPVWMIEEHRARGVARVGHVDAAAGEIPHEPRVDGAERQFAGLRLGLRAGHMVEHPLQLGGRRNRRRSPGRSCAGSCGASPRALSWSHAAAVRRSCQTMALQIGLPVLRSQTTVVSRWLVMPMAGDVRRPSSPALASASVADARLRGPDFLRIVLHPAGLWERSGGTPAAPTATTLPAWSKTMARELVVP